MVQMGKDVVTFLAWAAEPEMEERKLVSLFLSVYVGFNGLSLQCLELSNAAAFLIVLLLISG